MEAQCSKIIIAGRGFISDVKELKMSNNSLSVYPSCYFARFLFTLLAPGALTAFLRFAEKVLVLRSADFIFEADLPSNFLYIRFPLHYFSQFVNRQK
jgi:hypothetical protein